MNSYKPFAVSLQETWLRPGFNFRIPGHVCLREDRTDGYGGVALILRGGVPFVHLPIPNHSDKFSIIAASVNNICFVNMYIPHPSNEVFDDIRSILSSLPRPILVMGDFNAQHSMWGSSKSDHYGARILDILDDNNLCLLNSGCPTRRTQPHEGISAPDLTLCSPSLAPTLNWWPLSSSYGSDHFPLMVSFPQKICEKTSKAPPRLKYRLKDANWSLFGDKVQQNLSTIPPLNDSSNHLCAEAFTRALLQAAEEVFPIKNNSGNGYIPSPPWWDSECSAAIAERKIAEENYRENSTTQNFNILSNLITKTRKLLKQKRFNSWKSFCASISPEISPSQVWQNIRRFRSAFKPPRSPFMDSSTVDLFLDKLAPPFVPSIDNISSDSQPSLLSQHDSSDSFISFSLSELKGVLSRLRDSAPGCDGIPYSFLQNLNDSCLSYFLSLINSILTSGNIPPSWKIHEVIPIHKPNKPINDPSSYRPIALASVISKICEHLVKNRLEWFIESKGLLSPNQFGFRKGRSTMDSLSIFMTDIRLAFSYNKSVLAAFLDVSAAYDNVNLSVLKQKMINLNIPQIFISFIINLLSGRMLKVISEDSYQSRIVWKGLPQGSVLSPLLYNIYSHDLEASLRGKVNTLQYADDLLLYVSGDSIDNMSDTVTYSLKLLKVWLDNNSLSLSVPKSIIVLFSRMRLPPSVSVFYNNIRVPVKSEATFLGVILDSRLTGSPHCYYISDKCEKILNILRCLSGVWWGAHPFSLKLLYNALIRSILDYGTFILEPCNAVALHKLDIIQSKALRIIAGAMRSSPINALQVECSEAPLHLRRQFLCDRFLFRAFQVYNHPLYTKLRSLLECMDYPYWAHKSPPCLIVSLQKYLALQAPTHRSQFLPIFCVNYDALTLNPSIMFDFGLSKQDLSINAKFVDIIDSDSRWKNCHLIFSDSSKPGPEECVGVGIFHQQFGIVQKIKLPPETSVFTGECFGLLKSLEYILMMKLKKSIILTDAKSALQALERFPFNSNRNNHPVIIACRDLLYQCCIKNYTVSFAWIPGHSGIFGNAKADSLAKAAVNDGDLVPYKNFCCDLALLPKFQLLNSWTHIWRSSRQTKGRYYSTIQVDIPPKPWFSNLTFGKAITSTLIRMRLGHACIPLHLARLNLLPSDICECGNDVGDFNHIFFACPRNDRSAFISSLLSIKIPFPTSISILLSNINIDVYRILASFIFHNNIKL